MELGFGATYLLGHLLHLLRMAIWDSSLVIAQNRHFSICFIIVLDLIRNATFGFHIFQELGHGIRCIVGTKHLCT